MCSIFSCSKIDRYGPTLRSLLGYIYSIMQSIVTITYLEPHPTKFAHDLGVNHTPLAPQHVVKCHVIRFAWDSYLFHGSHATCLISPPKKMEIYHNCRYAKMKQKKYKGKASDERWIVGSYQALFILIGNSNSSKLSCGVLIMELRCKSYRR